jgi:glutathione synthase/RimK-type ligase-like ATP-grasp enzyme
LETAGIKCFPDFHTTWFFDDKVGQKYLLESIGAPLVPSYVFYNKSEALKWVDNTTFPKVFKLRGGAGATNVRLAQTKNDARKLVCKAFGKGFPQFDRIGNLKERFRKWNTGKDSFDGLLKGLGRFFFVTEFSRMYSREKGYAYFQDYLPNNTFDIRVCVVGNHAFALKRLTRENDFRASGSGIIIYDKKQIDERCVKIAFDVNTKLKSQSIAYDFVFDANNQPKIIEISYGYAVNAYDCCEGYWTNDMIWHQGDHFDFCGWMVEDLVLNTN